MMSSTLGAPLGGTTRGGHQGFESAAVSLMVPPNFGGGGGSCLPSMVVVVAPAEPNTPLTSWAEAGAGAATVAANSASEPSQRLCVTFTVQFLPLSRRR